MLLAAIESSGLVASVAFMTEDKLIAVSYTHLLSFETAGE